MNKDRFSVAYIYKGIEIIRDHVQVSGALSLLEVNYPHCMQRFNTVDEAREYIDKNGMRKVEDGD